MGGEGLWWEGFVEKVGFSLEGNRVGVVDGESGDDGADQLTWLEREEYNLPGHLYPFHLYP